MSKTSVARPPTTQFSDHEVAKLLSAVCGWKDGHRARQSAAWQSALADYIAAVGVKGFPMSVATARQQLRQLMKAVA